MIKDIRQVLTRSHATLWQDAIGGAALMIGLVAMLYLPAIF